MIKNLKGLDSQTFLKKLEEIYDISKLESARSPDKKGTFSLLLDSDWYSITPKQKQTGIDSQILTDTVLSPVLGILDLKNDASIDFVGGIRGLAELERRCKDDCKAAFALHPVSIEELIAVADAG